MQSCVLNAIVHFRWCRNKEGITRTWMPSTELHLKSLLPQKKERANLDPRFDLKGLGERTIRGGGRAASVDKPGDHHTKGFGSESSVNITNDSLLRGLGRTKRRNNMRDFLGPASVDTADDPALTAEIEYEVLSISFSNPFALFLLFHSGHAKQSRLSGVKDVIFSEGPAPDKIYAKRNGAMSRTVRNHQ